MGTLDLSNHTAELLREYEVREVAFPPVRDSASRLFNFRVLLAEGLFIIKERTVVYLPILLLWAINLLLGPNLSRSKMSSVHVLNHFIDVSCILEVCEGKTSRKASSKQARLVEVDLLTYLLE